jgi:hypothetical protein
MKHLSRAIIAVFMAVLIGTLLPVQVFADTHDYISEVKIFAGDYSFAEAEGYTLLKDGSNPVDLNQDAGGSIGSKGEKSVYLGYKTTKNKNDAITDLALMNMKGGYRTNDYESLMNSQMNAQIIPFVDSFLSAIKEYRENYNSKKALNKKRAKFVHDALNKLTDDDCGGAGLGDLLLNQTKYEMGNEAYNALSDEQKKEHADILTIIAQSNGNATLIMENLITRASDTNDDLWLDRFAEITYDDLVDATGETPTDAAKTLAKLYDDNANEILDMWADFQEHLDNYDNAVAILDDAEGKDLSDEVEAVEELDFENDDEEDVNEAAEASVEIQYSAEELANAAADVFCKEYLETIDYEDGTMLDFFMQSAEDIEDDITVLYPLVASLSKGQKAGLEFVTLQDLVMFGAADEDGYREAAINAIEPTSIYLGVDRAIYEKGGVALTSDAIRSDVLMEPTPEQSIALHIWSGVAIGLSLVGAVAFIGSSVVKNSTDKALAAYNASFKNLTDYIAKNTATVNAMKTKLAALEQKGLREMAKTQSENIKSYTKSIEQAQKSLKNMEYDEAFVGRMQARSSMCSKMRVGAAVFTVAMVAISAFLVYLDYQEMKEYYNVAFTPMPRYIIDEKDLIGYNSKGEKIVLKNQSAYYKLVDCNRTQNDEMYKVLGTGSDMNGDVGQQWLALYAVKNEAMEPILASSLQVVVDNVQMPAGYTTGIHMFGTEAAFNLNSGLYDWNDSAPSVYIYFKTDDSAASTTGANFTAGMLALAGGSGLALGVVITALAMTTKRKKTESKAATA